MNDDRLLIPKNEAFRMIGVGLTKGHELITASLLDARKSGTRTLITAASLQRYAESLPKLEPRQPRREQHTEKQAA